MDKHIFFADGLVGAEILSWVYKNYPQDIGAVIVRSIDGDFARFAATGLPVFVYKTEDDLVAQLQEIYSSQFTWGFLLWWPFLVSRQLRNLARLGIINTHPSYLPYNRGKHFTFWALVEQVPFGVSLHLVDDGIDTGPIIAQRKIVYTWEDTSGSLYSKAQTEMIFLFQEVYPDIRSGNVQPTPQDLNTGSFHRSNEIDEASRISLDRTYKARDLLNLLRARTFPGHPGCWFVDDDGTEYEVTVTIRRRKT
jgi:methionyl-tRNA formyltransferase